MADLFVALDVPSRDEARKMVGLLGERATHYKVGLELFARAGPDVVRELVDWGKSVFLDLKLHDIPNTVARAVEAAAELGAAMTTVHVVGGSEMLAAAGRAASGRVRLVGVTVLTSLAPSDLEVVWGRDIRSLRDEVVRLAVLAGEGHLDGVVASVLEAGVVRRALGPDFLVVTPGIRPAGADRGDQRRVATPAEAVAAGADCLVVGRAVTAAADPASVLATILEEMVAARPHENPR
jgi:orotidine-5'-phosphate decarboxylase